MRKDTKYHKLRNCLQGCLFKKLAFTLGAYLAGALNYVIVITSKKKNLFPVYVFQFPNKAGPIVKLFFILRLLKPVDISNKRSLPFVFKLNSLS